MTNLTAKAQMLIRRPPTAVFDAFIDASTMSKFWFSRHDDGLKEGQTFSWRIGDDEEAPEIEVRVKQLSRPENLRIEWGQDGQFTTVVWTLDQVEEGVTKLCIEECGFSGNDEEIARRALDSTGGFNQVIVALKALLEHGAEINVVADHA